MGEARLWQSRLWSKTGIPSRESPCGNPAKSGARPSNDLRLLDEDIFSRHVLVKAAVAGGDCLDLIDHVAAFHDLPENTVTEAVRVGGAEIQEVVIHDIEEELRGCRVRIRRARHGHSVSIVLQTLARFVFYRGAPRFLLEPRFETAALYHESVDHAMEDRVVVKAVAHVLQEILRGYRRLFGIEFDDSVAHLDLQFYFANLTSTRLTSSLTTFCFVTSCLYVPPAPQLGL